MKVLQINAVFETGSTGLIVKDIASAVEKEGGTPYYAFLLGEKKKNCYVFKNKLDRYFHAVYTRLTGKQGYASKIETVKFLKWVDKIKPDIVHLHNLHSNFINLKILFEYLSKKNIATVITMHDCWYFTGKCMHFVEAGCNKWQDKCGDCPVKFYKFERIFKDFSTSVVLDREKYITSVPRLKIVGCSKWIADECKKSRLKNCDITYIRNGVDVDTFKPTESKFRKDKNLKDKFLILGFANKWLNPNNEKNLQKILENLQEDDRVVLIGCNTDSICTLKNKDKIICLGFIKDRKQLADVYSSCDVFVNLTHADTLPTVNMECICSGTPVITFDCTGSPELVDEGSGYVVKENDVDGVIQKIKEIKKYGFAVDTDLYRKRYDKNFCYEKYLSLYNDLIKEEK